MAENNNYRNEELKSYVKRLSEGEDLESVREDFVKNFTDVDASEIMKAEQDLMKSGVPYQDVQRLCDVHSALFHGATREEKIANAEKAVAASMSHQSSSNETSSANSSGEIPSGGSVTGTPVPSGNDMKAAAKSRMTRLSLILGHPVNIFVRENDAIEDKIKEVEDAFNSGISYEEKIKRFEEIRPLSSHYAKKGDLLYPMLNARYGISGPSQVMWGVDDEIRKEISVLCEENLPEEEWTDRALKVLQRAREMIFKEQNILLPICVQNFSDEEWKQMARDIQDYDPCLTERIPMWQDAVQEAVNSGVPADKAETSENGSAGRSADQKSTSGSEGIIDSVPQKTGSDDTDNMSDADRNMSDVDRALQALKDALAAQQRNEAAKSETATSEAAADDAEITLPSGHFTKYQLRAILNTVPLEISFVDDKDINRYFNEGPKAFKRPLAALDREVYYCHPPKVENIVRGIISQFRAGTKKSFEVWMEKQGHTYLVRYLAVYDDAGKFVGTMECVENMDEAKKHFSAK